MRRTIVGAGPQSNEVPMVRVRARRLFSRLTPSTEQTLADVLRTERAGGILLLIGTIIALVWANSAWAGSYDTVKTTVIGPHALHLDLALETWAKDGLLAIFFFVIGLELKREIVAGELRRPATAIVPITKKKMASSPSLAHV